MGAGNVERRVAAGVGRARARAVPQQHPRGGRGWLGRGSVQRGGAIEGGVVRARHDSFVAPEGGEV
jgi:hypothetical protein